MPNMDGTGPNGQGPKTGKQMGNCDNTNPQIGFGRGCGRGFRGRGSQGRMFKQVELSKEEKQKILKAQKEQIEQELKDLE